MWSVLPALGLTLVGATVVPGAAWTEDRPQEVITIDMEARRFHPSDVLLPAGRTVRLVLRNHDSELHAFVPTSLFAGVGLNVTGNGFPEFNETGFRRLIVPPNGHAEIGFVPVPVGDYAFSCDMPGHDMKGVIHVR
ncbi:MAG: cupredoxin domain-containing protein [Nitrospiraceae bacterium]